jgi:CheY-like chemotaxis protein
MPNAKINLLVVDDEPSIRMLMSHIFTQLGHRVRTAEDGFSALLEIRQGVPDVILSDLNMPGMSGFELLSIVRRRFPSIQVIAMSGAFSGHAVPAGVAAHAFYEKATSLVDLLQIVNAFTLPEPYLLDQQRTEPIWITRNGHDPAGTEYVTIACPECLRTFPQVLNETTVLVQHANCLHCHTLIDYAIVQPADPASSHRLPSGNQPQMPLGVSHLN